MFTKIKAFTLVELLIVIGIIALLISVLLPALAGARRAASSVKCESNLRVLGQSMVMYLNDNKQTYPQAQLDGDISSALKQANVLWFNALDLYLARQMKDYGSASGGTTASQKRNYTASKQDPIWETFGENTANVGGNGTRTYKMNTYFGDYSSSGLVRWTKASKLHQTSQLVLLFDGIAQDCSVALGDPSTDPFAQAFGGDENYVGLRHGRGKSISANVLFVDGHVATILQPYRRYASLSGKSVFDTWYYEFVGATLGTPAPANAARNPNQTLYWDYTQTPH